MKDPHTDTPVQEKEISWLEFMRNDVVRALSECTDIDERRKLNNLQRALYER